MPVPMQLRLAGNAAPGRPIFGPAAATVERPAEPGRRGPLYAGECIDRIGDVRPAGQLVRELAR